MKFPLAPRPFAPLQLTQQQCDEYEHTALAVLLETVDEFDHFVHKEHRKMDMKVWKVAKTRDNLTVYKKRELEDPNAPATYGYDALEHLPSRDKAPSTTSTSAHSSSSTSSTSVSATTEWTLPKLLGVGTIVGNLDDVMYGVISPDMDAIKVKTAYVDDEIVDSELLHCIRHPNMDDPYRFLAIKWFIKAHPASVNAVVKPRDLTFIESTGTYIDSKGDRYGYHTMHSVVLPTCPGLEHLGILRGKISSCFIFKQVSHNTVEVFMKSFVQPAGNVPDIVAIMSATNGLIGFWKSVWSASNKKLAWLMRDSIAKDNIRSRVRSSNGSGGVNTNAEGKPCCALCESKLGTFRPASTCELCLTTVCSRCKTTRKLTYVVNGEVRKMPTVFCKNCITMTNKMNAADFARFEHVAGALEQRRQSGSPSGVMPRFIRQPTYDIPYTARASETPLTHRHTVYDSSRRPARTLSSEDWKRLDSLAGTEGSSVSTTSWSVSSSMDECQIVPHDGFETDALTVKHSQRSFESGSPPMSSQHELWMQMNQLRLQAEQAYRLTRQNHQAMAQTPGRRPRPSFDEDPW